MYAYLIDIVPMLFLTDETYGDFIPVATRVPACAVFAFWEGLHTPLATGAASVAASPFMALAFSVRFA